MSSNYSIPYSPYGRVPKEIWTMIFVHCLTFHSSYGVKPIAEGLRDPRLLPLVLASVCRVWRDIACNTAELWEACWVNFSHPTLNAIWLKRAGGRLLRLYGKNYKFHQDLEDVFLSILPFQKQWKSFELDVGKVGTVGHVPQFETGALEMLHLMGSADGPLLDWLRGLLHSSPRLRELKLEHVSSTTSITNPRIPSYLTLSSLTLDRATPREVFLVLSTFPQLQHLTAQLDKARNNPLNYTALEHTSLVSFQLIAFFDVSLILDNLVLPSLHTFYISYPFISGKFLDFVRNSNCRIIKFVLGGILIPEEQLTAALQDYSIGRWIERLEFLGPVCSITPNLLDFLRHSAEQHNLPHLIHLSFNNCNFLGIPDGLIADTVISRCNTYNCLCALCGVGLQAREVWLQYAMVGHLQRTTHNHSLDIARLVPLPEDRLMDKTDTAIILDLVTMEHKPDPPPRRGCSKLLHPVTFTIGRP